MAFDILCYGPSRDPGAPEPARELLPGLFRSSTLAWTLSLVRGAAQSRLSVLILGETGTGKELVARALHSQSGRTGPFVALNAVVVRDALRSHSTTTPGFPVAQV